VVGAVPVYLCGHDEGDVLLKLDGSSADGLYYGYVCVKWQVGAVVLEGADGDDDYRVFGGVSDLGLGQLIV